MSFGLDWINDVVNAFFSFVPRPLIVRATHGGVKWRLGKNVKEMLPGWHVWWPLTTETAVIVTARQTYNAPTQSLMTRDRESVVAGSVIVYSICDVVMAIGQKNWDVDTTVNDITQAAVMEVITQLTLDDLMGGINDLVRAKLTKTCRRELRKFGVYVHRASLTDFSICKTYNILGGDRATVPVPDEDEE